VYAVSRYGVLRWITNETTARKLYGPSWNTKIHDLSDAFFSDYLIGQPISSGGDYIIFAESTLTEVWQNIRPAGFTPPTSQQSGYYQTPTPVSPPPTNSTQNAPSVVSSPPTPADGLLGRREGTRSLISLQAGPNRTHTAILKTGVRNRF
jgi:hypothetical protein